MKRSRHVLVCGLGASGDAAARLLLSEGSRVTLIDRSDSPELRKTADALEKAGAQILLGAGAVPDGSFDLCVISPGFSPKAPWVAEVRRRGIDVLSEMELGWSRRKGPVIAVTGSNGKSTAVKWLAESINQAGLRANPGGNYGPPVCRMVMEEPDLDYLVMEVSSFQLESVRAFRAEAGILLNLNPNHLDRHGDMHTYLSAKARLFSQTKPEDACVVPEDLLDRVRGLSGGRGRWITFGQSGKADYRFSKSAVRRGDTVVASFKGTRFDNEVLGLAAAAVVAALEARNIDPAGAVRAAEQFEPLPHRMQPVAEFRGVRFVNDSKGTNLSAMAAALAMTPGRVRLIAGGLVKENDFGFIKVLLAEKAAGIYLIGQASDDMASAWSDAVPCFKCGTLDVAVRKAWADAHPGETVLLSPACASFDQFRNFEERGERFTALVKKLAEEK